MPSSAPLSSSEAPAVSTDRSSRRAELSAAAYRLIAARGLDGLSMRLLAREVGATTGLVTHHFIDRAEVIAGALEHAVSVMRSRLVDITDPRDALVAVLPTDDESIENWRFAFAVRGAALVDPTLATFDAQISEIWHRELPAFLEAGSLAGGSDRHEAVDHLVAVVDGVALQATRDPKAWPIERQRRHLDRAFSAL